MSRSETWEWDQYWQSARLAACDGARGFNYRDSIRQAWQAFFDGLGDGRTLVDIATGNGAVPLMARETTHERGWQWTITGVDSAAIDPATYLAEAGIETAGVTFLGNTRAESMPFEDASVDVVTSQYGLEYTDMNRSVGEVARIMKPGAAFQFIMHAADGGIVASAKAALYDVDHLLDQSGLFEAAEAFFRAVRRAESTADRPPPALHEECLRGREAFERALQSAGRRAGHERNEAMFRYVITTIVDMHRDRGRYELQAMLGKIGAVRDAVVAHRSRLHANVNTAMGRDGLASLSELLASHGLAVEAPEPLLDETGQGMIGWIVRGGRPR